MYITQLHVKNLKRMRDLGLDFTHDGKPRMWTVFVAENGACKTTLLQAIALAASGATRANQLADVPSLPDLRAPSASVAINAEFVFGARLNSQRLLTRSEPAAAIDGPHTIRSLLGIGRAQSVFVGDSWFEDAEPLVPLVEEKLLDFDLEGWSAKGGVDGLFGQMLAEDAGGDETLDATVVYRRIAGFDWKASPVRRRVFSRIFSLSDPVSDARAESFPGWFVAGYGTQRQLPVPLGVSELKDRVLNRLEPLFGKAPLVGTGFANQFVDTPFFEPFIRTLQKVLVESRLLPHVEAVELRGRGGMSQPGDLVRSHSFEFEFSGQKTKIPATWLSQGYQSTIAWIADVIGQMYLDVGEPIPLEDMEGMVLIDELDLHLHPSWQVRLVPVLKRVFPRMQFIVTTHSPMLLPALERHEIVMLRLDENGDVVAEPPLASPKLMTGSEIYSSFFNIQKLYPSDLGDELRRYTYLSSDPTRTDEEDAEMLRLQKKLTDAGLDLGLPPVPRDLP